MTRRFLFSLGWGLIHDAFNPKANDLYWKYLKKGSIQGH